MSFCNQRKIDIIQTHFVIIVSVNNGVIVIENKQKIFKLQLQLQLSTFENFQLQLQQNCVLNYNFVNCNIIVIFPSLVPALDFYLIDKEKLQKKLKS